MRHPAALLAMILAACALLHTADAVVNCANLPDVNDYPALNGATIPSTCVNVPSSFECKPNCTAGYTSYPDPVLVCGFTGTWTLKDDIGCNEVCPGDPPVTSDVTWFTVNNPAGVDNSSTPVPCTDRIPVYNASTLTIVQCDGNCSAGFGSPVAKCERNATTNALQWSVSGVCASGICNSQPPIFNNGTIWPLKCTGTAAGGKCVGTCRTTPSFWATGNDTDQFPTISCVEDATQPTGARWDTSNVTGNCVPVCVLPQRIWIRNGSWPEWCEPKLDPISGLMTQVGGLTAGQICSGVCLPGYLGTPQWVCSPKGKFKSNRTGDCFPAERGGCWGPLTVPVVRNSPPWDRKCWDMRVGWNCSSDCNGNWNTNITNPATIGYGTAEVPYLPHANCVANASDPYKGSYTQAIGQCVQVCRGPLPVLAGGSWPDNCLPRNGGIGGLRTNNTRCTATCNPGFSGANGVTPYVTCTSRGWSTLTSACNQNGVQPAGACEGVPSPGAVTNVGPGNWPCQDLWVGQNCTAICNSGGNPNVTYASGSPTIPAPTVTCLYDASALPYLGQYSSVIAGRCVGVCRNGPPAVTGVTWPVMCTPQADGRGGIVTGAGTCNGSCATGYTPTGSLPPSIKCSGGNWVSLVNPCVLNSGRRLRVEGM